MILTSVDVCCLIQKIELTKEEWGIMLTLEMIHFVAFTLTEASAGQREVVRLKTA